MKIKQCINHLKNGEYIILQDDTSVTELKFQLNEEFYSGKDNINKLSRYLVEQLEVKEIVAKNTFSVGLYEFLNNSDLLTYANDNLSKSYGRCDNPEDAAKKMATDIVYYLNVGADKFCGRVLECFNYLDELKELRMKQSIEEKAYFIISVSKGITAGEGYDIYLELDNNANEQDAVDKAIEDCLFEESEDVSNIFSVEKVSKETYRELTGEPLEMYKIPVVFQSSGFIEVKSTSLENAVKYAEKHLDEYQLPKNPQYIEDSFEIDYGSLENSRADTHEKGLPLDKRIAEADKKKSDNKEHEPVHNEIIK